MKRFLCVCLSSTIQRTITFANLEFAQVNRSEKYRQDASGKAINSARVLNQLEKGCVQAVCPLGEENQAQFVSLAEKDGLPVCFVTIPGATRECWTLLSRADGTTTELVVGEPSLPSTDKKEVASAEIRLLKKIADALDSVDAVLLAGSRPEIWSENLYATIAGIAKDSGKIFLADYIGADLERTLKSAVPDVVKINDEEFCRTFSLDFPCPAEVLKSRIIEKSKVYKNAFVITRGCDSTFAARDGVFFEQRTEKVCAVNTTACGDSFNAGFLYEFVRSGDMQKSLEKGTWCAARNAELEVPGGIRE